MTTKLEGTLKREIMIAGKSHTLTLDPQGLRLTEKGRRLGLELSWEALANGDAALAQALQASLSPDKRRAAPSSRPKRAGHSSRQLH